MKTELKENQSWAAKISLSLPNKKVKVNSQIKLTNPQMLIFWCLNIYMVNKYPRIDIRFLSAINGARNNTSNCHSDLNEAEYD